MQRFLPFLLLFALFLHAEDEYYLGDNHNRYSRYDLYVYTYKPIYFGQTLSNSESNRSDESFFQFSFKYEIFEETPLYLGYTQKSFWTIESDGTFRETNYAPELFYTFELESFFRYVQIGFYKHEANGEAGSDALSFNTTYLEVAMIFDRWTFTATGWMPALFATAASAATHADMFDYFGNWEVGLTYGVKQGNQHSITYRQGTKGSAANYKWDIDLDNLFSIEQARKKTNEWNPSFYLQIFTGHGETLNNYNKNTTRVTAGFSFVK